MNGALTLTSCLLVFMFLGVTQTSVVAGERIIASPLLVDLDAVDVAGKHKVDTWPNRGTLADFTASGNPIAVEVDGVPAIMLDGKSWFNGPISVPAIEGDSPRSVEVIAYNPTVEDSETLLSWSHRDGPAGSLMALLYGTNTGYGAGSFWGGNALAWAGDYSPAPAAHNWWYLVYTYDGIKVRVYVNGELNNSKTMKLNTLPGNMIRISGMNNLAGGLGSDIFMYSGFISEVRIHGGALSEAAVQHNMACLVEEYFGDLSLVASWTFDEGTGNVAWDSAGTSHAIVNGATWADGFLGSALQFDGIDDYVNCGNESNVFHPLLTANAWVNVTEFSEYAPVLIKGGPSVQTDFGLALVGQQVCFDCGNDDPNNMGFVRARSERSLGEQEWYMVSGVRGRSDVSVFINGIKENSKRLDFVPADRDHPITIGSGAFTGVIDEVQIYSGALDQDMLSELYQYDLDAASGTTRER